MSLLTSNEEKEKKLQGGCGYNVTMVMMEYS
jgi:hypothetical protein